MEKYLRLKEYYEDSYDRHTVDICRRTEDEYNESIKDRIGKKMNEKDGAALSAHNLFMYFETGERYLQREDTIKGWMGKDQLKDELLENAREPENIFCNKCGSKMYSELKTLYNINLDGNEKVLFIFCCSSGCKQGRAIFTDGEEWVPESELCDKCGAELNKKDERKGDLITTYFNCPECGNKRITKWDMLVKETKENIAKFFNRDRERFCLSKEKGEKYIEGKRNLEHFGKLIKRIEERQKNKKVYDKVAKLKKLTIIELENLLAPALEKEKYVKLELGKPEPGRGVGVEFNVRDGKSGREDYDSRKDLKKIVIKTLEGTNWKLSSDSITYCLGFLTGRLRGYELDEDLLKLIK